MVTKYNGIKNQILLSYEDEEEKWHKMDVPANSLSHKQLLASNFEGTLDNKKIKYRIVALAVKGEGAVRKFGDDSDLDAENGVSFPPIRPATSPAHLPQLVCNTQVRNITRLHARCALHKYSLVFARSSNYGICKIERSSGQWPIYDSSFTVARQTKRHYTLLVRTSLCI